MPNISRRWPSERDLAVVCGSRIKDLRAQRSLSQRALAEQVQISKSMVTRYERGIHTPPASVLIRLADVLRVPVDDLLGHAVQDSRLVRCLQYVERMDDESRQLVVQALESIVTGYRTLLARRAGGPPQ